jgi:hypothetical protein
MTSMPSVSHSEVDSYLLCRRKHYYGYGLSLERISTSHSLATGTAGHRVLETFYRTLLSAGDTPSKQLEAWDVAFLAAQQEYDTIVEEGYEDAPNRAELREMLFNEDWGYFANEFMVRNGWTIMAVEAEFSLVYDEEIGSSYPFVVDLIVKDSDGK